MQYIKKSWWVCLLLLLLSPYCTAETYYIGTDGNDSNSGLHKSPWKSLDRANKTVKAGDIVIILPGKYPGVIRPTASGTSVNPIIFRAQKRRTVTLSRKAEKNDTTFSIHLDRVKHVIISGLDIAPTEKNMRWIYAINTSNVTISDVRMMGSHGKNPFKVTLSKQFKLLDSDLSGHVPGDDDIGNMVIFSMSNHILIAGCSFSKAGHSPLMFYPAGTNSHVVIKGNVFHSEWGRNLTLFDVDKVLLENNIITHAYNGGKSADAETKLFIRKGVFRFNRVINNWGTAINANTYDKSLVLQNDRFYNNVFAKNYGPAIQFNGPPEQTRNVVFQNNVFTENDLSGGKSQIRTWRSDERDVKFKNNVINGSIWLDGIARSKRVIDSVAQFNHHPEFRDNYIVAPTFANPTSDNYKTSLVGNLVDKGEHLSQTTSSGKGAILPVSDVYPFYDGFGISGEVGDFIQVGDKPTASFARIIHIDYSKSALYLDRTINWSRDEPVSLPWAGNRPDVGMHEVNSDDKRLSLYVNNNVGDKGTTFLFTVELNSIIPQKVVWNMGDGSIQLNSLSITRNNLKPGNYPIRLKITDDSNIDYYATAFIIVEDSTCCKNILIETTFDSDDEEWWWKWQVYRPEPAAFKLQRIDKTHNQVLYIYAPKHNAWLSSQIFPKDWFISKFPLISFRYKISPGTNIKACIYGFEISDSEREHCVAYTSGKLDYSNGEHIILINDNKWHTCLIDANWMKSKFPQINQLKAFKIMAIDPKTVKIGQGYWLDDFSIMSEKKNTTILNN